MRTKALTEQPRQAMAPPLKWAGGKRWLLPHLQVLWVTERERRLVEPFMGGLGVSLGLAPTRALLNDSNAHLVNFYRRLHDGLEVTLKMRNDEETFYRYRARFNDLVRGGTALSGEGAQLFYYLNRTCFNGLCRFNKNGEFNVPIGRYSSIDYEDTRSFQRYKGAMTDWEIADAGDFEQLVLDPGDFVYADPPYDDAFTGYDKGGFSWADQDRLAAWLATHEGPTVASNHATQRIKDLYREHGFVIHELDAPRRISCTGDRTAVAEMLATRNLGCSTEIGTCRRCGLTVV